MSETVREKKLYGLTAEFDSPEALIVAAEKIRDAGYRDIDAFTPFPVHGLTEAMGVKRSWLGWLVLLGGVLGGSGGLYLQYWINVIEFPVNIGGRPFFSWPAFVPVIFECTVLGAALFAVFGMFGLNGLPRPHHPIFDAEGFERASDDRFFIAIEAGDPCFDFEETRRFMNGLQAMAVTEVYSDDV
ncbi:MAG: DUF3341 domain-containing protein [Verrucomicrobia bacterium]|nr:DUF3341 domain-containing protein [Verrucomicrobiota bacterium]